MGLILLPFRAFKQKNGLIALLLFPFPTAKKKFFFFVSQFLLHIFHFNMKKQYFSQKNKNYLISYHIFLLPSRFLAFFRFTVCVSKRKML